jgi:hypothetical protein
MKTIVLKDKDISDWAYSSGEIQTICEGGIPLPPHTSCGRLKKGSNEKSLKTQPVPSLRRSSKSIIQRKKKKKTKRSPSNETFLVCHYCKKKGHNVSHCWYIETCSYCGKKAYCEASCYKNQATSMIASKGTRTIIVLLYNNKLIRKRRKGLSQVVHTIVPIFFSTIAS